MAIDRTPGRVWRLPAGQDNLIEVNPNNGQIIDYTPVIGQTNQERTGDGSDRNKSYRPTEDKAEKNIGRSNPISR